jgi:enoyl-[acyl-carrier protein] reductase III
VEDIEGMIQATLDRFGQLDVVVSNAAAGGFRPASQLTLPNAEAVYRANALPLVWLAQTAADALTQSASLGKVIAISSHGAARAIPNYAAIGASKAALESFVRHLALELGPRGINFNCIVSGMVATDAIRTMPDATAMLQGARERLLLPSRDLEPQHIADAVAFLASSQSDFIQGHTLVVDGGVSIRI